MRGYFAIALGFGVVGTLTLHCSNPASDPGADPSAVPVPDASSRADSGSPDAASPQVEIDARVAGDAGAAADASDATDASASACSFASPADGTARVLAIYTLPKTSIQLFNPFLTQQQLDDALANGAGTLDAPGPGSGLEYLGGCGFLMITDRGPNADRSKTSKTFPLPAFTPTAVRLHADGDRLVLDSVVPLLDTAGAPVTGVPNGSNDDIPYLTIDAGAPLPYNPNGLDTEDIRRLPNGDLLASDEYGPSLVLIDGVTGKIKVRYTPSGVTLPGSTYPVKPILPGVLTNRRVNKGFEGLAVTPDGKTAYAVLQTPMGDEDVYGDSLVNRIVRIANVDDPAQAMVSGHYIVLHSAASTYPSTKQPKVFFNSATWLADEKLLVLERGEKRLKILTVDLNAATNLLGQPTKGEGDLDPESLKVGKGYAALGITPATTASIFDSNDTPTFITNPPGGANVPDKLEGLAILNETTVAISNDNDFGILDPKDPSRIWVLRLKAKLPR